MPGPRPADKDRAAAQIERAERRRKATKMATDGHTYDEIAAALGYNSRQAAHRDVKAGLAPALKELTEVGKTYLAVQAARLEQAHRDARRVFDEYQPPTAEDLAEGRPPVADQRLAALDRVLKTSESFRKLLGLDAPTKTESTIEATVGYQVAVAPEELEQL